MSKSVTPIKFVPLGPARLSYVNLFEPVVGPGGGEPVRSVALMFPKSDTKCINDLSVKLKAMVQAGVNAGLWKTAKGIHIPMRDGDAEEDKGTEYRGMYFMNAKSWRPVGIVDGGNNPIIDPDELYSGCWANVQISFKTFNTSGNKGIRVEINLVQKVRDDDRFDGVDNPADIFSTIAQPEQAQPDTGMDFFSAPANEPVAQQPVAPTNTPSTPAKDPFADLV